MSLIAWQESSYYQDAEDRQQRRSRRIRFARQAPPPTDLPPSSSPTTPLGGSMPAPLPGNTTLPVPSQTPSSSSGASQSSDQTGVIAGCVAGGVAVLLILAWYIYRMVRAGRSSARFELEGSKHMVSITRSKELGPTRIDGLPSLANHPSPPASPRPRSMVQKPASPTTSRTIDGLPPVSPVNSTIAAVVRPKTPPASILSVGQSTVTPSMSASNLNSRRERLERNRSIGKSTITPSMSASNHRERLIRVPSRTRVASAVSPSFTTVMRSSPHYPSQKLRPPVPTPRATTTKAGQSSEVPQTLLSRSMTESKWFDDADGRDSIISLGTAMTGSS